MATVYVCMCVCVCVAFVVAPRDNRKHLLLLRKFFFRHKFAHVFATARVFVVWVVSSTSGTAHGSGV